VSQQVKKIGHYFGGISGLVLPVPKYQFPPEFENASRLTYYASFFNSIEINSSFYNVPMKRTVTKWADSVHEKFKFTFKLHKEITHVKNLNYRDEDLIHFIDVINGVGSKKGCLLVQFPPSVTIQGYQKIEKLTGKLRELDPENNWNLCLEFRNRSWYTSKVFSMLHSYDANLVRHDMPASATPFTDLKDTVVYYRFHGPTGDYRGDYDSSFLAEFAQYIQTWTNTGKDVFIYFNNTAGNAFNNLVALNKLATIASDL
jgi:uncharacterized protein YecE (DUF72 family)